MRMWVSLMETGSHVAGGLEQASGGMECWSQKEFPFRLSPEGLVANFSSEKLSVLSLTE